MNARNHPGVTQKLFRCVVKNSEAKIKRFAKMPKDDQRLTYTNDVDAVAKEISNLPGYELHWMHE